MHFSAVYKIITSISHGVPPLGASDKGGVSKISSFLFLTANIWKMVADTAKVTIND